MYKTKIVIIDSGVNVYHPLIVNQKIKGMAFIKNESDDIIISSNIIDNIGHGTAIYNIIKSHMLDSDIYVINIYQNNDFFDNEDLLLYALNYVAQNIECDIINISLGICIASKKKELYEVCERLAKKKVMIVAAFDNNGAISFPAAFDNVIGVTSDKSCKKNSDIIFVENSIVNICAKGEVQRVSWTKPAYIYSGGNSFACAHVTGILANLISNNYKNDKDIDEIYKKLKNLSLKSYTINKNYDVIYDPFDSRKIKRAIIFPFNKEMHSLIRFNDMLNFNIIDVYDIKHSGRVGSCSNKILNVRQKVSYNIKNIQDIDMHSFDTCILGHVYELNQLLHDDTFVERLVKKMIDNNKNIYSLDRLEFVEKIKYKQYFYPGNTVNNIPRMDFGKLYIIPTPVIGVYGTSSKQGKYTLQLILRKKLSELGYKVGQMGTEPTAYLFGMDSCYHFGYNSDVQLGRSEVLSYINNELYNISNKNADIIITGCQGGTVTYEEGNVNNFTFKQSDFLIATQPDAVLLCINYDDEYDYVLRTIKFIEGAVQCKVIALVLFPMKLKNNWSGIYSQKEIVGDQEYVNKSAELIKIFQLPVYKLGEELEMDKLTTRIIDYFS